MVAIDWLIIGLIVLMGIFFIIGKKEKPPVLGPEIVIINIRDIILKRVVSYKNITIEIAPASRGSTHSLFFTKRELPQGYSVSVTLEAWSSDSYPKRFNKIVINRTGYSTTSSFNPKNGKAFMRLPDDTHTAVFRIEYYKPLG